MRRLSILLAAMLLGAAAHAEVYSWREGGATRYSNFPPAWYSATEPGRIRTRVTVNGILVDDTGLPAEERDKLRALRAKAEAWNRPGVPSPATPPATATATPTAAAPVPREAAAAPKPPAPPPPGTKPGEAPARAEDSAKPAAAAR